MLDMISSPWLPVAVLAATTAICRIISRSWFAPAALTGLIWTFFCVASLLAVDYPVPGRGMWMLVLLVVAIQLGALVAHELRSEGELPDQNATDFTFAIQPCRVYGLICTLIALAGCVYFLFTSLEEFGLPFTPIGILEVGAHWTLLRYDDAVEPWSVRLLVMWLHPAALLGGLLFACSKKRVDRFISAITVSPALFYGILTGARAAILIGGTCWIAGYLSAVIVLTTKRLGLFTVRRVITLLLVAVCGLGMFASIDAVRDSSWVHTVMFDVREQKLQNYMFGSPAAFADWYAHSDKSPLEWGARTFAGEFDLLQLRTRVTGRYLETSNVVGTENTNVYTLFRGLVEDFGEAGSVLASLICGLAAGWFYSARSTTVLFRWLALSAFYATVIFSPLVSFFSFNGPTLGWLLAAVVLIAGKHRAAPQSFVPLQLHGASPQ